MLKMYYWGAKGSIAKLWVHLNCVMMHLNEKVNQCIQSVWSPVESLILKQLQ